MIKDSKDKNMKNLIDKGCEFRNFTGFEIRAKDTEEKDSDEMIIEGVACVFDKPTVLFEDEGIEYSEVVDKRALDEADISDVIFNYNHGGRVYARTRNDSLHLEVKEDGLHVRIKLNPEDEGHKELYRDIKSGLIDKMSYCYIVADGGFDYDTETHTRRITSIKKVFDVSAVDIPAYDSTSISTRSILDLEKAEMEKLENDILKKKQEHRKRIALAIKIKEGRI